MTRPPWARDTGQMSDVERSSLLTLIEAADGRATWEPVSALAIALMSPWASSRRDFLDRPNRMAPPDTGPLLEFLEQARPLLSPAPLPTSTGFLAWLSHRNLAVPAAALTKSPRWLTSPELAGAWVAVPPVTGYPQAPPDEGIIAVDGRLAALHLLLTQVANNPRPQDVPHDAVTTVLGWFVGRYAVPWSDAAADQNQRIRAMMRHYGYRAWALSARSVPVADVERIIARAVPIIPASWAPPPPSADQIRRRLSIQEARDQAARRTGRQRQHAPA
jgi:hypothetical protein